jgi:hypothetical protein
MRRRSTASSTLRGAWPPVMPCPHTDLTQCRLKGRGKGAPKKKREKGMFMPLNVYPSFSTRANKRRRQGGQEMSTLIDERCFRCDLYQYCIEEGYNIPGMTPTYERVLEAQYDEMHSYPAVGFSQLDMARFSHLPRSDILLCHQSSTSLLIPGLL